MAKQVKRETRSNKNSKKVKQIKRIVIGLVAILLVIGTFIFLRLKKAESNINVEVNQVQLRDKEVAIGKDSYSILLLGIDNGAYGREKSEGGRSDAMLLVTVNTKENKTTIISIPRDSYADIIGYGISDKINHAYAYGKETMSINSVQNFLNIPIDYFVTVDMNGLMKLVDAVGGLEITPVLSFTYEDETFVEGQTRHVDGEAALRYARMRYDDPDGDNGRQLRQQYVIQKIVEKLLSLDGALNFESVLQSFEDSVQTNLTMNNLLAIQKYNKEALRNFTHETIEGEPAMINGIYYFLVQPSERIRISNILRESLGLETITQLTNIETKKVQDSEVKIDEKAIESVQQNSKVNEQADADEYHYVTPKVPSNNDTWTPNSNNYTPSTPAASSGSQSNSGTGTSGSTSTPAMNSSTTNSSESRQSSTTSTPPSPGTGSSGSTTPPATTPGTSGSSTGAGAGTGTTTGQGTSGTTGTSSGGGH